MDYLNSNQIQDCAWQEQSDFAVRGAPAVRGALVSTRFRSYDELRAAIGITHYPKRRDTVRKAASGVGLTHCSNGLEVVSILRSGVSEKDFVAARDGGFWDRISLVFKSPYAVIHRKALQKVSILARRRPDVYGEGDPAFYDLSEHIMAHIVEDDLPKLDSLDLASEKGYFNTVNHITAQVFMTALFSEKVADLIADAHERKNMPELVTGLFSQDQLADLENGPVDNYVDMINNEWGQELGKKLREKHGINPETEWTPELLTDYLNDIQAYYSWAFQVGFRPFRSGDEVVKKFCRKMDLVLAEEKQVP